MVSTLGDAIYGNLCLIPTYLAMQLLVFLSHIIWIFHPLCNTTVQLICALFIATHDQNTWFNMAML